MNTQLMIVFVLYSSFILADQKVSNQEVFEDVKTKLQHQQVDSHQVLFTNKPQEQPLPMLFLQKGSPIFNKFKKRNGIPQVNKIY